MTLAPLTFDWPMMSALSIRPPYAVPAEEWLAEIDEEIAFRAHSYPMFVRDRRMKAEEADRHRAILAAIRDDVAERLFWEDDTWKPGLRFLRTAPDVGYEAKVRELRREIDIRRNSWPQAIDARRMDKGKAALRMERLEAVHFAYWVDLFRIDDLVATITDREEWMTLLRAYEWRADDWRRHAADAGDPAANPAWSTKAVAAKFERRPSLDPLCLAAARRHGFVPAEQEGLAA